MPKPLTLLIDGDIVAYQAALASESEFEFDPDQWTYTADAAIGKRLVDEQLSEWRDKFKADTLLVALTDGENFRKKILATYKANRKKVRRPLILKVLRQYLKDTYTVFQRDGLEADDCLGILATAKDKLSAVKGDRIIVSIDKDFQQIPGWVYNPNKDDGKRYVGIADAAYYHLYQTLIGDATDGYAGCPGVGPVKAEKILAQDRCWSESMVFLERNAWDEVVRTYAKANIGYEDCLTQARVARILRYEDYDFTNKQPKLWLPEENC